MKSVKLWIAAVASIAGILMVPDASAQDGYVTNSNARGVIPFGSYQVGGIDNENLATGTVNLRIPLTERNGRGSDTNLAYVYSSKIWTVSPLGDPLSPDWVPAMLWQPTSELLYGQIVTLEFGSLNWTRVSYTCTGLNLIQYWVNVDSNFVYIAADGAHIQFPNRRITAQSGYRGPGFCSTPTDPCKNCVPPANNNPVPIGYSDSGTMELNTSGDPFVIRFKDGRQAFWPANQNPSRSYKDRNGNIIDSTGDTLKRTVFADSNGNPLGYSTATAFITVNTQFPTTGSTSYPNCVHQGGGQLQTTTSLSLPNGRSYTFEYDPNFGELTRVNLPTAGYIKYVYQTFPQIDNGPASIVPCAGLYLDSRRVVERRVSEDGVNEHVWQYRYVVDPTGKQPTYTDVTDPLGNVTRHIFMMDMAGGLSEVQTETRDAAGNLLRKVVNDWDWDRNSGPIQTGQDGNPEGTGTKNLRIVGTTTTLVDTNQVSRTETDYDKSISYPNAFPPPQTITESMMNVTETREFDYGIGAVGPLLRRTHYTYLHDSDANYQSRHIWDRVASRVVYDGQSNVAAKTQYGYDGTPIASTSSVVQHDYVNYASTMPYRGNVTTTQAWRNTDDSWLTTTNWYDDLGNLVQTQDPGTHNTWFAYDDNWSGTACLPSGPTRAFVTQVKNHLGQTVSRSYYACSSLAASVTDQNSQTTTFTYDFFDRPLVETRPPGGGSTTYTYNDVNRQVTRSVEIGNGIGPMISILSYDGLGRHNQTQQKDPEGDDFTETTYDALGRVATVNNPHRATASTSDGITTYQYDALGRIAQVAPPDGTPPTAGSTCLANNRCTQYSGNITTVTDETGRQRRSTSDALGRLVEVDEPGDAFAGTQAAGSLGISGTLNWGEPLR
jgi:YD repeat-containing protein